MSSQSPKITLPTESPILKREYACIINSISNLNELWENMWKMHLN